MTQLTAEQIYSIIKTETGLSDTELQSKISEIKEKYQGLLSDVGANIMLSKQLNVNLDLKNKVSQNTTISEILSNSDMDSVSLYARIRSIPPVKKYKAKDGSDGKIQSIYLYDGDNLLKLNLWNEKASVIDELELEVNDLILVKDAFISTYNNKVELSLRAGGQILKNPENSNTNISIKNSFVSVSDATSSEDPIETIGRITVIYPKKSFTSQEREKFVTNFEISDGKKSVKCVAWDPWAEIVSDSFSKGDLVKLSNIMAKDGLYDLEFHLNFMSTIKKNPKTPTVTIPPLSELLSSDYELGKTNDLEPDKSYKLEGTIISVNRNKLRSFKCPVCKERVSLINETDFICESCATNVDPDVIIFSNLELDDGNGTIKLTMFGSLVEDLFSVKKEDLKKELSEEEKENLFLNAEKKILGKQVIVTGRAKLNNFSNAVEFMVNSLEIN